MKRTSIPAFVLVISQIVSCAHKPGTMNASQPVPTKREPSSQENTVWTDWSTKSTVDGLKVLKSVRDNMLQKNLTDPHVSYTGYSPIDCSKLKTQYRQADGSCTNLENPHAGAAGVAFGRNVPPSFIVTDDERERTLMTPSPAQVSKEFFTREDYKPIGFLNMLAAVWIQFMNHDWMTHGPNEVSRPYRVKDAPSNVQFVDRTKVNPVGSQSFDSKFSKVTANDVTHWWDASQIYGSSTQEVEALRSFSRGKMRVTQSAFQEDILPSVPGFNAANNRQNQGMEATGFRDNWWLGLSMLHTLFVREHNAIADMLYRNYVEKGRKPGEFIWRAGNVAKRRLNPTIFSTEKELDEHLFQTARLINAAVLAKIHTVEWTPAVLPNRTLQVAMCGNWYGIGNKYCLEKLISNDPKAPNDASTKVFRSIDLGHIFGGIVGSKTKDYGVPFSITEEFTSVYRLHSLLPEALELRTLEKKNDVKQVPFSETRNEKAYSFVAHSKSKDLFYSFGRQNPGQLVLNNFPLFMQNFEVKGHNSMDLGMVDIIRDRERGVPRYNQFRRGIGLKPILRYTDFFLPATPGSDELTVQQHKTLAKFYEVYGRNQDGSDNVEAVDLLVGTLAEEVRPKNFGFGETMFHIFILMASRRLMADRFFTEDYNAKTYTQAGLDWIDQQGTLARVIERHMPELAPKMKGLWTAFLPWKE